MGVAVPFDKYLLLGRVNVGGMAEVFLSKTFGAEGFERFIAIKRLLPQVMNNKEFIDMFIDEAKIAVQLTHSNIAQIYELGKHADQLFIALEFVHGKELRALAARAKKVGQRLDPSIVAFLMQKAADGLDYAHQKKDPAGKPLGIVHRDISPQNMLVSFDGELKLIDFGIAKAKDRISQTQVGVLKGKIGYMSPEQVTGVNIDQRSDLFSLGCVLYELITGERAFKGSSDFSTFEKVRNAVYVEPEVHHVKIDPELDRIMRKALAKDREQRYQRGAELSADLQRYLLSERQTVTADTVAELMRVLFKEEYAAEMAKLAEYRQMKPPRELLAKEPQREAAEELIDDHTRVSPSRERTRTDRVAFAREEDQDDPKTLSESIVVPKQETAYAATEISFRRPSEFDLNQDDLSERIQLALKESVPGPTTVVPLTKVKEEGRPPGRRTSQAVFDQGPFDSPVATRVSRTATIAGEEDEDGFTVGELLLIAGAGVIAVLFVVGVYFYTQRGL